MFLFFPLFLSFRFCQMEILRSQFDSRCHRFRCHRSVINEILAEEERKSKITKKKKKI